MRIDVPITLQRDDGGDWHLKTTQNEMAMLVGHTDANQLECDLIALTDQMTRFHTQTSGDDGLDGFSGTLLRGDGLSVTSADLYKHYQEFCEHYDVARPLSRIALGRAMARQGVKTSVANDKTRSRLFLGIGIKDAPQEGVDIQSDWQPVSGGIASLGMVDLALRSCRPNPRGFCRLDSLYRAYIVVCTILSRPVSTIERFCESIERRGYKVAMHRQLRRDFFQVVMGLEIVEDRLDSLPPLAKELSRDASEVF